jgi:uncharacterized delta-60 repeat protein
MNCLKLAGIFVIISTRSHGIAVVFAAAAASLPAQVWAPDPTFSPVLESSAEAVVPALHASPGGKLIVVPRYAVAGTAAPGRPLRLNRDGTVDFTFVPPSSGLWPVLAVQSDERVVALRTLTTVDGAMREVVRLTRTGALDDGFVPVEIGDTVSARVLADGRILIFGSFTRVGMTTTPAIAVLNADGGVAAGFRAPFPISSNVAVYAAQPLGDGRIVITGNFRDLGPAKLSWLARLNADGSVDATFNPSSLALTAAPELLSANADGTVLIRAGGQANLLRVTATGARDPSYTPQLAGTPQFISTRQPDGKIYYLSMPSVTLELRRLNGDGTPDGGFVASGADGPRYAVTLPIVADDGALFVGSPMNAARAQNRQLISRLRADGSLDTAFGPRASEAGMVEAFLRLPDGKTLVTGNFSHVSGVAMSSLRSFVRLNADGSLDPAFVASLTAAEESISELWAQPGGKILARGTFSGPGGTRSLVRFNSDGSRDATFTLSLPLPDRVAVDAAGSIYDVTTDAVPRLVRYNAEGQLDPGFQYGAAGAPGTVVPVADGGVWLLRNAEILRLRHDGSVDAAFVPSLSGLPGTLLGAVPLPDGRVVFFTENRGTSGSYMRALRLTSAGTVDFSYVGQDTGGSSFLDYVSVGGVLYDLLRDAGAGTTAALQATFGSGVVKATTYVDTSGRLLVRLIGGGGNSYAFEGYRRSSVGGVSVDYAPTVVFQSRTQPSTISAGGSLALNVVGGGLQPVTYQWFRNGQPIAGATRTSYQITGARASDAGDYSVTVANAYGTAASFPTTVAVAGASTAGTARLVNISTRGRVGSGGQAMIAGFVVTGSASRTILVRAIGPALANLGLDGVLRDPQLTLRRDSSIIAVNDNWGTDPKASVIAAASTSVGAFPLSPESKDAALLVTLEPGSYTAEVSAASGPGGIALVEVYDTGDSGPGSPRLVNIATRGIAGSGTDALVAGLVVRGDAPKRVLIRAVGPELSAFGVEGILRDPVLTLYSGDALLQSNDDWARSSNFQQVAFAAEASGAFPLPFNGRDASLLVTLAPGNYTAQVADKAGSSGVALVEVYEVP